MPSLFWRLDMQGMKIVMILQIILAIDEKVRTHMTNPKIATIVPLAHLNEIKDDDYFMALSYAISNSEYAGFFNERAGEGKHVILDNSAVELGEPEDFKGYLEKAMAIHASEIMLPDVFRDPEATLRRAKAS